MNEQSTNCRDEGARRLQAGDLEGALRLLQQAVAENPEDGRAYGFLGVCQARRGDLAASIASLQEAARLQPHDSGAHYNLAVALFQAQRLPEAQAELERTLTLDPNHARAQAALNNLRGVPPPSAASPFEPGKEGTTGERAERGVQPLPVVSPVGSAPAETSLPSTIDPASAAPPGLASEQSEGMHYTPAAAPRPEMQAPTAGLRVLRGLLWGILYGQWWTLWTVFWMLVWGGLSLGKMGVGFVVVFAVICVMVFGFFGSLTGLIIGAANASPHTGVGIGVGVGMVLCLLEVLLFRNPKMLVNVLFYYFTGRYIGFGITARVQQPIRR